MINVVEAKHFNEIPACVWNKQTQMYSGHLSCLCQYIYLSSFGLLECLVSHVTDFDIRNKILTAIILKQGYHKLSKAFSKFYRRHYDRVSKSNLGLKSFLKQGLSELELYGDFV